jgi:hypothetical protein
LAHIAQKDHLFFASGDRAVLPTCRTLSQFPLFHILRDAVVIGRQPQHHLARELVVHLLADGANFIRSETPIIGVSRPTSPF